MARVKGPRYGDSRRLWSSQRDPGKSWLISNPSRRLRQGRRRPGTVPRPSLDARAHYGAVISKRDISDEAPVASRIRVPTGQGRYGEMASAKTLSPRKPKV
jgi:hypothetical protein